MVNKQFNRLKRAGRNALTAVALLGSAYCGGGSTDPTPIINPPQKPIASFTVNPKEGYAPFTACFDGSSSRAPESAISKYIWSFGDGVEDSNSGMNVCHNYTTPGSFNPSLTVESMRGDKSLQALEQIVAKDGKPSINVGGFNFNEDQEVILDLKGKITSPIYDANKLKLTATSPNLSIILYGTDSAKVKNKTKDWNGAAYIDWNVVDPDGRPASSRTNNILVNPQTDIRGFLEHVLTGARIPAIIVEYKTGKDTTNANGEFEFEASQNDTLKIDSPQHYKVKIPLPANGQDVDLGNVQLIDRYKDPVNGDDLWTFIKTYMDPRRWDDADLPIKFFIDKNPPSQEYREAVRKGVMDLWPAIVNQWLPTGRQLNLFQIVPGDPATGVRVDYTSNPQESITLVGLDDQTLLKGIINSGSNYSSDFILTTLPGLVAHEVGHTLGLGWPTHSPHESHLMYPYIVPNKIPSAFEGLAIATKYKLKKDSMDSYEK